VHFFTKVVLQKNSTMSDYATEKQIKDNYTDRIPFAVCKKILNAEEYGYSDKDVLIIRDFLYSLAVVDFSYHERKANRETKIIEFNPVTNDNAKKSYPLLPSKHRRAG
jgi:hypothetical protein